MKFEIKDISKDMVNPLGMLLRKSAYAFSSRFSLIGVGMVDVSTTTGYSSTDIAMRLQGLNPWINENFINEAYTKSVEDGHGTLNYSEQHEWYEYSIIKNNTNEITLGDFGEVFNIAGQDLTVEVVKFASTTNIEMTLFIQKVSASRSMQFNENVLSTLGEGKGTYKSSNNNLEIIGLPSENCKQTIRLTPIEEDCGRLIVEMDMPETNSRELVRELLSFFNKVESGISETEF